MTPALWRRIDGLFAGPIRFDPVGLASWLRQVCGGDEDRQAQVGHLLTMVRRQRGGGA